MAPSVFQKTNIKGYFSHSQTSKCLMRFFGSGTGPWAQISWVGTIFNVKNDELKIFSIFENFGKPKSKPCPEQGSSGYRRPGSLKPSFLYLKSPRSPCYPSWLGRKFLGYKAGVFGRRQGILQSRTARTSTSSGGLVLTVRVLTMSIKIIFYCSKLT